MTTKTNKIFLLSAPYDNPFQGSALRYVFVCSAGLLRSPTAAAVAIKLGYNARSCGCEDYALIPLSANLIEWAHKIFFMNEENYMSALNTFRPLKEYEEMILNKAVCWDIEDEYDYDNHLLKAQVKKLLT